jgi:hypothetical protein
MNGSEERVAGEGDRAIRLGMLFEFAEPAALLEAVRRVRQAGYDELEAYSPYPLHGLVEALGRKPARLPWLALAAGLIGIVIGYAIQYYPTVVDYPLNVGGRPLHSWPSFFLVTFELGILFAALAAVAGFFWFSRLPRHAHPVFRAEAFRRASQDRFFLWVPPVDAADDLSSVRQQLAALGPLHITEIPL